MEITFNKIAALQIEAAAAGDRETHSLCAKALVQSCKPQPRRFKAFRQVERIILDAAAQE